MHRPFILYSVFDSRNGYQPILDNLQKEKGKWLTFLNPQPILVNLQKGLVECSGVKTKKIQVKKLCVNIKFWYRNIIDHEMKTELGTINGSKHKVQASCGFQKIKIKKKNLIEAISVFSWYRETSFDLVRHCLNCVVLFTFIICHCWWPVAWLFLIGCWE